MSASPNHAAASPLSFRMLGELQVRRGGEVLSLPPSKKTRALLAYLVLSGRPHRREALCNLLWDVTDDPRGALRWSLSKLRKLVDEGDLKRLVTDRERVAFELAGTDPAAAETAAAGVSVDVLDMRAALTGSVQPGNPLTEVSTDVLKDWCERGHGEVLEGLDLPDFDAYQAWLVAEREETRGLRARALAELVSRLERDPKRALRHARAWSRSDPMNSQARLAVIQMALRTGQPDDARRTYEAARRTFAELDPEQERNLTAGWRALRAQVHGRKQGATAAAISAPTAAQEGRSADAAVAPQPVDGEQPDGESASGSARAAHAQAATETAHDAGASTARPSAHNTARQAFTLPLTGRDEELRVLSDALQGVASSRRARLVLATGEPGIGKSRLLDEIMQQARTAGHPVLSGAAYEGEAGRPYGPWIDGLRSHPQLVVDERLAPILASAPGIEMRSREALFSGVADALSSLTEAGSRPLLMVLEDAHWLDEGSAELLHYVVRMQRDLPVLFVLSARPAELSDSNSVLRVLRSLRRDVEQSDLPLRPLPAVATARLVAQINEGLDAEAVHQRSGGNPLYVLSLARSGSELRREGSLADAVRERIDRLTAEAADLLRWCAVLGSSVDPAQLASLSNLAAEAQLLALEELDRHALLRADGNGYGFAHDVVKQVVYAGLSQPRRVLMHRRAAEALQTLQAQDQTVDEAVVADIARHAAAAGEHALAASAYVAAGKRCLKLLASENAAVLARRGLRHARELADPGRATAMLELHDILLWAEAAPDVESFCAELQALSETALQHGCTTHARLGFHMQSYVRWERGDWNTARKKMMQAEQTVRGGEGEVRVVALAQAARCEALLERDMALAESYLREAQATARQVQASRPGTQPVSLVDAEALLKRFGGEINLASQLFEQARAAARASRDRYGELQVMIGRFELLFDDGQLPAALEIAQETVALADKARDGSERPYAAVMVALTRFASGQDEAEAELLAGLQAVRQVDAKHRATYGMNRTAHALLLRGRHGDALPLAREAHALAEVLEWSSEALIALITIATTQAKAGDTDGEAETRANIQGIPLHRASAYARSVLAQWLALE